MDWECNDRNLAYIFRARKEPTTLVNTCTGQYSISWLRTIATGLSTSNGLWCARGRGGRSRRVVPMRGRARTLRCGRVSGCRRAAARRRRGAQAEAEAEAEAVASGSALRSRGLRRALRGQEACGMGRARLRQLDVDDSPAGICARRSCARVLLAGTRLRSAPLGPRCPRRGAGGARAGGTCMHL